MADRPPVRVCLIGFGHVGQAVARLLLSKRWPFEVKVVGLATLTRGTVANVDGLDLEACLKAEKLSFENATLLPDASALLRHLEGHCDAVLEAMNGSKDGQPALELLQQALCMKAHAITASKAPVALAYPKLKALAARHGKRFLFESSVMDGVPIFSFLRQMPNVKVQRVRGVLNSTTNVVLTRMRRERCSLEAAVAEAQRLGIAEREVSDDLDGIDAATKLAVLCAVLFEVSVAEIETRSVRHVTLEAIDAAAAEGRTLKVVCEATMREGHLEASVKLMELPREDPLASLEGASCAVSFETDVMGPITVMSTDPTLSDTAYGMLQDLQAAILGDGSGLC